MSHKKNCCSITKFQHCQLQFCGHQNVFLVKTHQCICTKMATGTLLSSTSENVTLGFEGFAEVNDII